MQNTMYKNRLRYYWLLIVLVSCDCINKNLADIPVSLPPMEESAYNKYYNLEIIDLSLDIGDKPDVFSFEFNGKPLVKENGLYVSDDLIVYQTIEGKWQATVIGAGGIKSMLQVCSQGRVIQAISIHTTSEVFSYQDELGPEWPELYNIGNTCFANAAYKLMARCPGFDLVLSQDVAGNIHTTLRNIFNGIRLGKRSALNHSLVNKKISKLFLDQLSAYSGNPYNHGKQDDAADLILEVNKALYSQTSYFIKPGEMEHWLEKYINHGKNPFGHIIVDNGIQTTYAANRIAWTDVPFSLQEDFSEKKYLHLPAYLLYVPGGAPGKIREKEILLQVQMPIWDPQTNQRIGSRNYRLVGFVHHIGSEQFSGHYVAYINFNQHGWYKHNDSQVDSTDPIASVSTGKLIAFYEIQD